MHSIKAYEITSKMGKPTTHMLEVDPVLTRAVNEILNCSIDHTELRPELVMHY